MTRPLLILLLAAAVTCLIGVPVLIVTADDDPPAKHREHAAVAEDAGHEGDAKAGRSGLFDWLRALALAENVPATGADGDDDARLGTALVSLDHAFDDGIARCAPEIMGYDRGLLTKLQPDWHTLKPNVRPTWEAWQKRPGVVVDDEKVKECAALFGGKTGPLEKDCAAMAAKFQECTVPFRGTFGEGSPCEAPEQCASGSCEGGVCSRPDDCKKNGDCPTGMMCASDPDEGINTCVDIPKLGQECVAGVVDDKTPYGENRCPAGLACDDDNKCFPARREGSRCGPGQPCLPALSCLTDEDGDMVCMKEVPDAMPDGVDESGGDPADGPTADEEGCACDPLRDGKACVNGRCVPAQIVELGDACDEAHLCRDSLGINACIDGVCRTAKGIGDACSSHDECKDDYVCNNGACAPPGRPGDTCDNNDDCIFGLICDGDPSTHFATNICELSPTPPSYDEPPPIKEPIRIDDIVINGEGPSDDDNNPDIVDPAPQEMPEAPDDGAVNDSLTPERRDEMRHLLEAVE